jgi:hypothetical protein
MNRENLLLFIDRKIKKKLKLNCTDSIVFYHNLQAKNILKKNLCLSVTKFK